MVLAFMLSFSFASAEEIETTDSTTSTVDAAVPAFGQAIKAKREAYEAKIKAEREAFKNNLEAKKSEFKDKKMAEREAFRAEIKAKQEEFKSKIDAERSAFKEEVEAKKAEFKANIAEKRSEFRAKAEEMMSKNFEAQTVNIERLQTRVSDEIEKLKAAGADTEKAVEYLAVSKQKLDEAKAKIAEVKALIPTTDSKVTVETFEKVKLGARDAKNLLKESHSNLVEALKTVKMIKVANPATTAVPANQ